MHFWIDKRSQGCGFNGRHLVPPSISGYGRCQRLAYHPKPMVTPVHRFQSIESVANQQPRPARPLGIYPNRPQTPAVHYNGTTGNVRHLPVEAVEDMATASIMQPPPPAPPIPQLPPRRTPRIKCGVWLGFVVVTFLLAVAKYYFYGVNIGVEAFAFCLLLLAVLIIGGLVSLYEAITATAAGVSPHELDAAVTVDGGLTPPPSLGDDPPPPPYHMAIMLPATGGGGGGGGVGGAITIRDSPPPTYEKAVA